MRRHLIISLGLLVTVLPGLDLSAQAVVDQSFLLGPTVQAGGLEVTGNQWSMQTFTVGIAGQLATVTLEISQWRCLPTEDLVFQVLPTDAMGAPILATPLAEIVLSPGQVTPVGGGLQPHDFDVLPFGIVVAVGDELAIMQKTAAMTCNYAWNGELGGYAGGETWLYFVGSATLAENPVRDMSFQTEVIPGVTCTLTGPVGSVTGDVVLTLDAASVLAPMVTANFDYSTDAGVSFLPCTAAVTSPLTNPAAGIMPGPVDFHWASAQDGVGVAAPASGVIVRASVDDGISAATTCDTALFDVDNTAPTCAAICGDCNLSGTGPDILDALEAAQLAAGLHAATPDQETCCDINSSLSIDVIDALGIAQGAAGLPVMLMCP